MTWWAYTLYALILLLAVAAYVRYRLHELESIKEIRASRLSLAQAQHQLLRSREEERGRLARDLHDGPLQTLVGLNIQLGLFLNSIRKRKKTDSPAVETVEVMQTEVRDLLTNLRSVCTELRPPMLDTIGLGAALTALAQDWSELNNVSIRLDLPPDETSRRLSGEVALNLYRIVQEALSNVTRHAQARQVDLHLTWENHQLELNIHDDGQGFQLPNTLHNLTAQGHFGLVGMRERAGLIGGEFSLQSAPGQGTTVRVTWRDPSSESK
jgi:signal transduction histidine kinase